MAGKKTTPVEIIDAFKDTLGDIDRNEARYTKEQILYFNRNMLQLILDYEQQEREGKTH